MHGLGPLLVLAGAGSGKTTMMASRIARLIEIGNSPTSILGLSFTNKAAKELHVRVKKLITRPVRGLLVTTFHSLCVRILRAHGESLGFTQYFSIFDQGDQAGAVREILRHLRIDDRSFDVDVIVFEMSQAKNRFLQGSDAEAFFFSRKHLDGAYQECIAQCYQKYHEYLRMHNAMDFDDLIFHAVSMLEGNAAVREKLNERFRYILIDEYQDTNAAQFRLVRALTQRQQNICVVGDDDQSIYGWRGADPEHILQFESQFQGVTRVTLDQNYRSTPNILELANRVIVENTKRFEKELWSTRSEGESVSVHALHDDQAEAQFVADEIGRLRQLGNMDIALIYRSNQQARLFEEFFVRAKIPYTVVGGMSFLDRKEVKDAIAYLKVIINPKDEPSLRRALGFPAKGIGATSLDACAEWAFAQNRSLYEALEQASVLAPKSAARILLFVEKIKQARAVLETLHTPERVSLWAKELFTHFGFQEALLDPDKASIRRWEHVLEIANALGQVELASTKNGCDLIHDYLSRLALVRDEPELQANAVVCLTLHAAKGLEFAIVFLVGLEEGFLPHQRVLDGMDAGGIDEERRLCYVGVTRAKDKLYLVRAKHRLRYGKLVPRLMSRFVADMESEEVMEDTSALQEDFLAKLQPGSRWE